MRHIETLRAALEGVMLYLSGESKSCGHKLDCNCALEFARATPPSARPLQCEACNELGEINRFLESWCKNPNCKMFGEVFTAGETVSIRERQAARAAPPAQPVSQPPAVQGVPAGYKLVPIEPTQAMCQDGQEKAREWPTFPLRISPIYQAMLAAAPQLGEQND